MTLQDLVLKALASGRDHAVPKFEGAESRMHRRRDIRHLALAARRAAWRGQAWGRADTLVLFAGFPRSGHSLVGAAVDSHPAAIVSHELDALGLFEGGLTPWQVAALIRLYAHAFRDAGQYWNGHSYAVPDRLPESEARVLGDKKGDWLVRRALSDPGLIDRFRKAIAPRRLAIVNVVRNPFDNVATLSLRKGRHYDRLKIDARARGRPTDAASLLAADREGRIPRTALPEMIEDYETLCRGLETLRQAVPPRDWFTLRHEDLVIDPVGELSRLFAFAGLAPTQEPARRAAAVVASETHATRHVVAWSDDARDRIAALSERYPFLAGYSFAEPRARRARPLAAPAPALANVHVMTAVGVTGDLALLPHFLDHYTGLGIPPGNIHAILNAPEADAPGLAEARARLSERGCAEPEIWVGPYSSREMWERRRALQAGRTGAGDWIVSADVDELHVYPEGLAPVLETMETLSADLLQGPMIDRLAPRGRLAPVAEAPDLFAQFPLEGDLMCQISRWPERTDQGGTVKVMLCSATILPGLGGHGIDREQSVARARALAEALGGDLAASDDPAAKRLERCVAGAPVHLAGGPLTGDPRIKDPAFRLSFPVHVAHFKWHAGLPAEIARRRASGLQTPQAERYATRLEAMLGPEEEGAGRIDLDRFAPLCPEHRARGFRSHLDMLRRQMAERQQLHRRQRVPASAPASAALGWRLRQLTFGSAAGIGHFHSYYDIPVLNAAATRIAAVRFDRPQRSPVPEDSVEVGVVEIATGGFRPLARSRAWSWQQGPMAQWIAAEEKLVWNDREGERFIARLMSPDGGAERRLERPVYALDPGGRVGLSLNFARLDRLRPGYGYAGGGGARIEEAAPEDDGLWKIDIATGESTLILSLARGVETLRRVLTTEERAEHDAQGFRYWFNHCKVSPDGRRFAVKLRWRRPDGPWTGLMGVSMTCGMDGADPRVIARAASHVMWHDPGHLYFWNQRDKYVARKPDAELVEPIEAERLAPEEFTSNVHLRHLAEAPARMVYDVPYQPVVHLREIDLGTGRAAPIATFPGHDPAHGQFRCDLHPVPTPDGNRIVVSAMSDGARQLYVLDREDAP
ncbi:hypothetical protein ATO8_19254 [Roseivivax marinus]|uniref:Uncharacterized protein n=1 Tax=Roseivivax marinus TaxID=1379903 RepID=W4HG81_9RHOB|nr:hypothetical protein [Roseivivax marinus]ETW10990.1 hypothetical protein ATO8_19254 [Roseivivax marinus]